MPKIAIIGAGLAGLSCARALVLAGHPATDIAIFEKSRGVGGRMATRYAGDYEFDHGAQFFTCKSAEFGVFVSEQALNRNAARWPERLKKVGGAWEPHRPRFVGKPRMNSLCKMMAEPFKVELNTRVAACSRTDDGWYIRTMSGSVHGPYDYLVCAIPAPQVQVLLPEAFGSGAMSINKVRMAGCFALMLGFEAALDMPWMAAEFQGSAVSWIAVNSDKPGRKTSQSADQNTNMSIVVHSSNVWAEEHLEDEPDTVEVVLLETASQLTGLDLSQADHKALHRWRYAATPKPLGAPFLFDPDTGLAACGDWCIGSKVEAAFESGARLAEALLANMASDGA